MNTKQLARKVFDEAYPNWKDYEKGSAMRVLERVLDENIIRMFSAVQDFHEKFQLGYEGPPRILPDDMSKFRVDFMEEELNEYQTAVEWSNKEGQLDALVDLVYVALGTAYLQGFNFAEAFKRVHAANMAKVRVLVAEDSKRGSVYDVRKPEGWTPPDLSDLVEPPKVVDDKVPEKPREEQPLLQLSLLG